MTLAGIALLFTPYRVVLPPKFISYGLAAGISTLCMGVLGFAAACERRNEDGVQAGWCRYVLLWIFTLLNLLMLGLSSAVLVVYYHFEDVPCSHVTIRTLSSMPARVLLVPFVVGPPTHSWRKIPLCGSCFCGYRVALR